LAKALSIVAKTKVKNKMMHKKGQGAMEYLMTYGWAILVVIIVGVVLWQMGVFSGGGSSATTFTGFWAVKPVEWSCASGTNVITVTVTNGAGGMITGVDVTADGDAGACLPTSVAAGGTIVCTTTSSSGECATVTSGATYTSDVSISYTSPTNQTRTSSGTIRGPAD
jgi:hypothetical protein